MKKVMEKVKNLMNKSWRKKIKNTTKIRSKKLWVI